MPKKRINIILIPATIAIWILIIIRVLTFTKSDMEVPSGSVYHHDSDSKPIQTDTLQLLLNYRDPFNKNSPFVREGKERDEEEIFKRPVPLMPPEVKYKGYIKSEGKAKQVALIMIKGKTFLLSSGDTARGIRIVHIGKEGISYQFNNKMFTSANNQ